MPTVSFPEKNCSFESEKEKTLLDALLDAGHEYPHGCFAGSCGLCAIKAFPRTALSSPSPVEKDTLEREFSGSHIRLACRAKVQDNLEIQSLSLSDTKF